MKKFNVVLVLVLAIFIGSAVMAYAGPGTEVGNGSLGISSGPGACSVLAGFGTTGVQGAHTYGPGDGTGNVFPPRDGTGYGPGSITFQRGFGSSVNLRGYTWGPGDGTGNVFPPRDGTGYGPGPR